MLKHVTIQKRPLGSYSSCAFSIKVVKMRETISKESSKKNPDQNAKRHLPRVEAAGGSRSGPADWIVPWTPSQWPPLEMMHWFPRSMFLFGVKHMGIFCVKWQRQ